MSTTSPLPAVRADLVLAPAYHSPQVDAEVRLNTNECPIPPPEAFRKELAAALEQVEFNRYPDRNARALRSALADFHGVHPDEVFCANGSNEVLQCLLLAYGGPGRRALLFEPTYTLHSHIARVSGTEVVAGVRDPKFRVDLDHAVARQAQECPSITFVCSPNNPTGMVEDPELVRALLGRGGGLVIIDEAYGQFARWSALELRGDPSARALVVVRTFSKTWSMAAVRLGYLIADPEVVVACEQVALPYHLSVGTQIAGVVALGFDAEMRERVRFIERERARVAQRLEELSVDEWPSDANFILFRPRGVPAASVWQKLLDDSILVRDCSNWPGLDGCLRVTIGTDVENDRFLSSLEGALR